MITNIKSKLYTESRNDTVDTIRRIATFLVFLGGIRFNISPQVGSIFGIVKCLKQYIVFTCYYLC